MKAWPVISLLAPMIGADNTLMSQNRSLWRLVRIYNRSLRRATRFNKVFVSSPSWGRADPETDCNPYVNRSWIVNIFTGDSIFLPYQGPLSGNLEFNLSPNRLLTPYGAR